MLDSINKGPVMGGWGAVYCCVGTPPMLKYVLCVQIMLLTIWEWRLHGDGVVGLQTVTEEH